MKAQLTPLQATTLRHLHSTIGENCLPGVVKTCLTYWLNTNPEVQAQHKANHRLLDDPDWWFSSDIQLPELDESFYHQLDDDSDQPIEVPYNIDCSVYVSTRQDYKAYLDRITPHFPNLVIAELEKTGFVHDDKPFTRCVQRLNLDNDKLVQVFYSREGLPSKRCQLVKQEQTIVQCNL
jgi:hypothetical protein